MKEKTAKVSVVIPSFSCKKILFRLLNSLKESGYLSFQVIVVDNGSKDGSKEKIAKLILQKTDAATIERQAIEEGMITMKQDGYLKVLEGVSTIDEILRVAQE